MEELKEFRHRNGLTQDALGEYLGVKKSFISKIENGLEKMPFDKFRKLIDNEMGWDVSALKEYQVDSRPPLRLTELLGQPQVDAINFVSQDPRMAPAIVRPRTSREFKNERLMEENLALKKRIEELNKRILDLEKQNQEYWEMLKQLIVVVDR
jgi:transcriptional regulator with XRE-family HTH domain